MATVGNENDKNIHKLLENVIQKRDDNAAKKTLNKILVNKVSERLSEEEIKIGSNFFDSKTRKR